MHADDVAQAFQLALEQPDAATGQAFHVVAERALALRGFAEAVAGWFGAEPDLAFLPFDEWRATTSPEHADTSYEHVARSHVMSIEAARTRLGYAPGLPRSTRCGRPSSGSPGRPHPRARVRVMPDAQDERRTISSVSRARTRR